MLNDKPTSKTPHDVCLYEILQKIKFYYRKYITVPSGQRKGERIDHKKA
jgi:hypothetical protein